MDDKTAELRDIFIDATGSDTVTERQEEARGSLTEDERAIARRVLELIENMRERYDFETDLDDEALQRLVYGYFDGDDDAAIADELGASEEAVFDARMDLHLVREADRDAPFDVDRLRKRLADADPDDTTLAAAFDADEATVARHRRVAEAEAEATRANGRYRDEFTELLTDSDLSARLAQDAHDDGLREATEDIETNVSF